MICCQFHIHGANNMLTSRCESESLIHPLRPRPYFKKSERFHPPSQETQRLHKAYYDAEGFGTTGPVQISYGVEFSASHQYWHETWANLGVATNRAHLMGSNVGAYTMVASIDPTDRTRSYSATAYYRPIRHRPNLVVLTDTLVERIALEQQQDRSWKATGVHFSHQDNKNNNQNYFVSAAKEVILCAGSTQSPQLLELSGIGNPAILAKAGVVTKVASPMVGENLQDHIMAASIYEVDAALSNRDDLAQDDAAAKAAREMYASSRSGPLTVLANSVCYLPFDQVMSAEALADLSARVKALRDWDDGGLRGEIQRRRFNNGDAASPKLGQMEYFFELCNLSPFYKGQQIDDETGDNSSKKKKKYGTVLQILQYPFSRGSIHIKSADPQEYPIIDPCYYQGPGGELDLDAMVECAKFAEKFTQTQPLANIVHGRVAPPASEKRDRELRDWLIKESITDW